MTEPAQARKAFINAEAAKWISFMYAGSAGGAAADNAVVIRQYICECGFKTTASAAIFDHCADPKHP